MATVLKTRIQSKFDHISAWSENGDFVPLPGEMVVAYVPSETKDSTTQFLIKVGDGTTALSALECITAKSGDVWPWAKNENLQWADIPEEFKTELAAFVRSNGFINPSDFSEEDGDCLILDCGSAW